MTIEELEKSNFIIFKSIRGSHLFGLETETSDVDTFGMFCCPKEWLYASRGERKDDNIYRPYISDDKHDHYYDELEKYFNELKKSNPEALCALFTPEDKVLYMDSCLQPLWEIRDKLLTKAAYPAFKGYAKSQISKAKGLSKAMNIDPEEVKDRKNPLYFCWVPRPDNDGVWSLEKWLRENNLKPEHCGVTRLSNGVELYTLYYDWIGDTESTFDQFIALKYKGHLSFSAILEWIKIKKKRKTGFIEYRGILDPNDPESTQLRCSSISKKDAVHPLCSFQFNVSAFSDHCKKYRTYWDWVKNRNPQRYAENLGHQYDAKNCSHCIRIMRMATEIAEGKGMILDRKLAGDRDFLLDIKLHRYSYEEVMKFITDAERNMHEAFEKSNLPEEPDHALLDKILIEIRKKKYKDTVLEWIKTL